MRNCRVVAKLRKPKEDVEAPRGYQSGKCEGKREEKIFLEPHKDYSCGEALVLKGCSLHQNHNIKSRTESREEMHQRFCLPTSHLLPVPLTG